MDIDPYCGACCGLFPVKKEEWENISLGRTRTFLTRDTSSEKLVHTYPWFVVIMSLNSKRYYSVGHFRIKQVAYGYSEVEVTKKESPLQQVAIDMNQKNPVYEIKIDTIVEFKAPLFLSRLFDQKIPVKPDGALETALIPLKHVRWDNVLEVEEY